MSHQKDTKLPNVKTVIVHRALSWKEMSTDQKLDDLNLKVSNLENTLNKFETGEIAELPDFERALADTIEEDNTVTKLVKENEDLKKRVSSLEELVKSLLKGAKEQKEGSSHSHNLPLRKGPGLYNS